MNLNINFEVSTVYALAGIVFVLIILAMNFWVRYRARYKKMRHRRNRIFETSRKTEIKDRLSSY